MSALLLHEDNNFGSLKIQHIPKDEPEELGKGPRVINIYWLYVDFPKNITCLCYAST